MSTCDIIMQTFFNEVKLRANGAPQLCDVLPFEMKVRGKGLLFHISDLYKI